MLTLRVTPQGTGRADGGSADFLHLGAAGC
jgi:hypothetical protein